LFFSQQKFINNGQKEEEPGTTWWVPITYTTSNTINFGDTAPKVWLKNVKEADIEFALADNEWVILNLQQTGMTVCVLCTAPPFHSSFIKVDVNAIRYIMMPPLQHFHFLTNTNINMQPTHVSKVRTNCRQSVSNPGSLYSNKSFDILMLYHLKLIFTFH
jgi:hypothetical protein